MYCGGRPAESYNINGFVTPVVSLAMQQNPAAMNVPDLLMKAARPTHAVSAIRQAIEYSCGAQREYVQHSNLLSGEALACSR